MDYLLQFIRDAADKVSDNGHIFLGDLRSMHRCCSRVSHLGAIASRLRLIRRCRNWPRLIRQRTEQEEELLIDPAPSS